MIFVLSFKSKKYVTFYFSSTSEVKLFQLYLQVLCNWFHDSIFLQENDNFNMTKPFELLNPFDMKLFTEEMLSHIHLWEHTYYRHKLQLYAVHSFNVNSILNQSCNYDLLFSILFCSCIDMFPKYHVYQTWSFLWVISVLSM